MKSRVEIEERISRLKEESIQPENFPVFGEFVRTIFALEWVLNES